MKLLVTGGCGFLGSNLVADALRRGVEVTVLDNLSRVGADRNRAWLAAQGHFDFTFGDVANPDTVSAIVEKCRPDAVYHLAGQVAMTTSINDPRADFETNALGTFNVLEDRKSTRLNSSH